MPGSRSDGRPSLTPEQRDDLFARALETVRQRTGLVEHAQRQCERTAEISTASAALLRHADVTVSLGVRTHLEALANPADAFERAPAALVGSQWGRTDSVVEQVLAERVGSVAAVEGGARLVASALVGQPRVVVLHDDLVRPSPVEAALLIRALAPMTAVVIATDDPLILEDAASAALRTCRASVSAGELGRLLDDLLA